MVSEARVGGLAQARRGASVRACPVWAPARDIVNPSASLEVLGAVWNAANCAVSTVGVDEHVWRDPRRNDKQVTVFTHLTGLLHG